MKRAGITYRAHAIVLSIVLHVVVIVAARFLIIRSEVLAPQFVTVEIMHTAEPPPAAPQVEQRQEGTPQKQSIVRRSTSTNMHVPPPPTDVPVVLPDEPIAENELELIDRAFFGDSLYTIIKAAPQLRPLVLQQMLVEHVPTTDTLETLRQQLAEAMLPYINMSEAERQARFHMKIFGSPTNPMRPGPIPGNIPISDILRALIELLK